jgi:hypothetical protein
MIQASLREKWQNETLEFFTVRGPKVATDWAPRTAKDLASAIAGADWELLVALNAISAPATSEYLRGLPRLIQRELVADWSRQKVVTLGRVKGQIDVRATGVARAQLGSPAAVAYRKLERIWDTDENRALAGFLMHAERTTRRALQRVGTRAAWQSVLIGNLRQIRTALLTAPLRFVGGDVAWAVYVRRPSERRRSRLYSEFYRLASLWAETREASTGEALRKALGGWLVPATDDGLFETHVASIVVQALYDARAWESFELAPVGFSGRLVKARYGSLTATVSFDSSPSRALGRAIPGDYRWIYETYDGLDLAARRPDVTLHVSAGGDEAVVLFEAKATDANSPYGRDSIYKGLGYLKDFEDMWGPENPRVVLVFASGVESAQPVSKRLSRDLFLTADPSLASDAIAVIERMVKAVEG